MSEMTKAQKQAIAIAQSKLALENEQDNKPKFSKSNLARTFFQGLSFGFGDELEALTRSVFGDQQYNENLELIRSEIKKFRKDYPKTAIASEIVGSIPTSLAGGAGLARLGMKAPTLIAGSEGLAYGFGAGEGGATERGKSAVNTGLLSAATGNVLNRFMPSKDAKALLKEGVPLTAGQTLGGAAKKIEDSLSSIPFGGNSVLAAQDRAKKGFNTLVLNRALVPLGKKLDKNIAGNEAYAQAKKIIDRSYKDILPKLKVGEEGIISFNKGLEDLFNTMRPDDATNLKRILKTIGRDRIKLTNKTNILVGEIDGQQLKSIESALGEKASRLMGGGDAQRSLAYGLFETQKILRNSIKASNPKDAKILEATNMAFKNLLPVTNAVVKSQLQDGMFTPGQLMQGIKASDKSVRKQTTATSQAPLQDLAQSGQRVIGNTLPNSGTADRIMTAQTLQRLAGTGAMGGGVATGAVDPMLALSIPAATMAAYSKTLTPVMRNIASSPSLLRSGSPAIGSRLEEKYGLL